MHLLGNHPNQRCSLQDPVLSKGEDYGCTSELTGGVPVCQTGQAHLRKELTIGGLFNMACPPLPFVLNIETSPLQMVPETTEGRG
jgi:hypothetical protein